MKPNTFYHIYAHANGDENLFRIADNYKNFLDRYGNVFHPLVDTLAYCLLPNHFHFLVKTKGYVEILQHLIASDKISQESHIPADEHLERQFSHLLNGYAQAFNRQFSRKGALFLHPFKKKEIDNMPYLTNAIAYIHQNPSHHGLMRDFLDRPWSSVQAFGIEKKTKVNTEQTLLLSGGKAEFERLKFAKLDPKLALEMEF